MTEDKNPTIDGPKTERAPLSEEDLALLGQVIANYRAQPVMYPAGDHLFYPQGTFFGEQKRFDFADANIDLLPFGINDKELASLFKKTQLLSDKQKQTVKDLISAFVFQKDIQKQLT